MDKKTVSGIMQTFLFISILTLALTDQHVKASAVVSPYIAVVPSSTVDPTLTPGMNYTVEIYTDYDGDDVWGWQFELFFNPDVLEGLEVSNGDLITTAKDARARFYPGLFDNTLGHLDITVAFFYQIPSPPPTTSGPGTLAYVTFRVKGTGISSITLGEALLQGFQPPDSFPHIIDQNEPPGATEPPYGVDHISHGYFGNIAEGSLPPVASFYYSPVDPQIGEEAVFDASTSYDLDGTIVNYAWDFGDGETSEETDPETTHAYTTAGTYTVALTVTDNDGLTDTATATLMIIVHDVAVTSVEAYPTQVMPGRYVQIFVIVRNEGTVSETFDVVVYYDANPIDRKWVWNLPPKESQSLWFDWNTAGVSEGTYTISAEASIVPGETDIADNTYVDGTVTITFPSITVIPESGPVGTMVRVEGSGFPAGSMGYTMFDDELVGFIFPETNGDFNATFNVPVSEAGQHAVKAVIPYYASALAIEETFIVVDTTPLDIDADVGVIYFKGETAEFYVQTSFKGTPIDATSIHATLRKPDGTEEPLTAQRIALGIYKLEYALKGKGAMLGTHTLIVSADYSSATINATGTTLKTFIVKAPWREWERDARDVALSMATIAAAVGLVFVWRRENKKLKI